MRCAMSEASTTEPGSGAGATGAAHPLVTVQSVSKSFLHEGRSVPILRGIDLKIEEGEMLCIVGPSGAGKSTLLHLLGTLDLPSAGRIFYDGEDVTGYSS